MLNIEYTDIFFNAIHQECPKLSEKILKSISLMLALIENKNGTTREARAKEYAKNIHKYIQSKSIKNYNSLELAIAAIGEASKQDIEFLTTLQLFDSKNISHNSENNFSKKISSTRKRQTIAV